MFMMNMVVFSFSGKLGKSDCLKVILGFIICHQVESHISSTQTYTFL